MKCAVIFALAIGSTHCQGAERLDFAGLNTRPAVTNSYPQDWHAPMLPPELLAPPTILHAQDRIDREKAISIAKRFVAEKEGKDWAEGEVYMAGPSDSSTNPSWEIFACQIQGNKIIKSKTRQITVDNKGNITRYRKDGC